MLVDETWSVIARQDDPQPACQVMRVQHDDIDRMVIWKLVKHENGWYAEGQWSSDGKYRRFPEAKGVKLSNCRVDRILKAFAEGETPSDLEVC